MIRIVTGVMKSGKSKELIQSINESHQNYLIIKPTTDTRDGSFVKSRATHETHHAVLIDENNPQMIQLLFNGIKAYEHIFIDECQFFTVEFIDRLVNTCQTLTIDVTASGLLKDYKGNDFPSTRYLVNASHILQHLFGYCETCEGRSSHNVLVDTWTNSLIESGDSVLVEGDVQRMVYMCVCDKCYRLMKGLE